MHDSGIFWGFGTPFPTNIQVNFLWEFPPAPSVYSQARAGNFLSFYHPFQIVIFLLFQCVITTDYAQGQQISKLADEAHVPTDECLEDELLQFADRFQEWALINKETDESEDPASVDLNAAVTQTRLTGWTALEKEAVLKVITRH